MKYEIASDICRICLSKNKKLRSLYKPMDADEMPPNIMIEKVTGINVEEMLELPMLPKNICKNCELALSMAYEFRAKTLESKRIIDLYLSSIRNTLTQQSRISGSNDVVNNDNVKNSFTNIEEFVEMQQQQQYNIDELENENLDECAIQLLQSEMDNVNALKVNCQYETNDTDELEEFCGTEISSEDVMQPEDDECYKNDENILKTDIDGLDEGKIYYDEIDLVDERDETKYEEQEVVTSEIVELNLDTDKLSQVDINRKNGNLKTQKNISQCIDSKSECKKGKTRRKMNKSLTGDIRYMCDICGNVYLKRGRMMEHRQRHDKELKYTCELCDKKFHMRELLRKHMYSHNGGKPLKCGYCSRTFYYESVRKAHENVHKGLKPYVCDVCGKAFCYSHTLKKHKLIHAEIKEYRCNYCNKNFRLQHHMKQHERTKLHKNKVLMIKGQQKPLNNNLNKRTDGNGLCKHEDNANS